MVRKNMMYNSRSNGVDMDREVSMKIVQINLATSEELSTEDTQTVFDIDNFRKRK